MPKMTLAKEVGNRYSAQGWLSYIPLFMNNYWKDNLYKR